MKKQKIDFSLMLKCGQQIQKAKNDFCKALNRTDWRKVIGKNQKVKTKTVSEQKIEFLMNKGMVKVGTVLQDKESIAIISDLGRCEWFKRTEIWRD